MTCLLIKKHNLKMMLPINLDTLAGRLAIKKYIDDQDLLTFIEQHFDYCEVGFEYSNNAGISIKICATKEEAEAS